MAMRPKNARGERINTHLEFRVGADRFMIKKVAIRNEIATSKSNSGDAVRLLYL
jgi:hypothetical protein